MRPRNLHHLGHGAEERAGRSQRAVPEELVVVRDGVQQLGVASLPLHSVRTPGFSAGAVRAFRQALLRAQASAKRLP